MQDYVKLLEATNRASVHRKMSLKNGGDDQFKILELIENMALNLRARLDDVLPDHIGHQVAQVKLELLDDPIDAPVLYKAQFYKHDRRNFQLRVYAHQQSKKGKGVKLARAVYYIKLQNMGVGRVA